MPRPIQPYLFFEGRAAEAIEFYKKALGAEVEMIMPYRDSPEPVKFFDGRTPPPDKVMHAAMKIADTVVMASDGLCTGNARFGGFCLTYPATDPADAQRRFDALAAGGKVQTPLGETFFAKAFGMVTDRFGVSWMVMSGPKNP